ncbi:MAG: hypothetical protein RIS06_664 [Actinomycetota bacterium]
MVSKAIGGVSPLGWISKPETILIDQALNDYDVVWAAAGTWNDNFAIAPNDLVRVSGGTVTDLKRV